MKIIHKEKVDKIFDRIMEISASHNIVFKEEEEDEVEDDEEE